MHILLILNYEIKMGHTSANTLQKTYVQTLQASFATGTLSAHCDKNR